MIERKFADSSELKQERHTDQISRINDEEGDR